MGDAHFCFGYFPGEWDDEVIIDWSKCHHEDDREDREGSGRNFQRTKLGVHGGSLLDREGGELS